MVLRIISVECLSVRDLIAEYWLSLGLYVCLYLCPSRFGMQLVACYVTSFCKFECINVRMFILADLYHAR